MGAVYRSGQKLQTFHIRVNGRAPTNQWSRRRVDRGFYVKGRAGLTLIRAAAHFHVIFIRFGGKDYEIENCS